MTTLAFVFWIIVALVVGGTIGAVIMALLAMSGRESRLEEMQAHMEQQARRVETQISQVSKRVNHE